MISYWKILPVFIIILSFGKSSTENADIGSNPKDVYYHNKYDGFIRLTSPMQSTVTTPVTQSSVTVLDNNKPISLTEYISSIFNLFFSGTKADSDLEGGQEIKEKNNRNTITLSRADFILQPVLRTPTTTRGASTNRVLESDDVSISNNQDDYLYAPYQDASNMYYYYYTPDDTADDSTSSYLSVKLDCMKDAFVQALQATYMNLFTQIALTSNGLYYYFFTNLFDPLKVQGLANTKDDDISYSSYYSNGGDSSSENSEASVAKDDDVATIEQIDSSENDESHRIAISTVDTVQSTGATNTEIPEAVATNRDKHLLAQIEEMPHGSIERQEILSVISQKNSEKKQKSKSLAETVGRYQHLRGSINTIDTVSTAAEKEVSVGNNKIDDPVEPQSDKVADLTEKDMDIADDDVPPIISEADLADDPPSTSTTNRVGQTSTITALQLQHLQAEQKKIESNGNSIESSTEAHLQGNSFAYKSPMQPKVFSFQQPTRNTDDSLKHLRWIHPLLLVDEPSD